jgi:hypothetical protein
MNITATTSRTTMMTRIPNTFTQRGVLGGRSAVGLTPVSSPVPGSGGWSAMCVSPLSRVVAEAIVTTKVYDDSMSMSIHNVYI